MIIWRLTTRSKAAEAFDGEGASKYGGRWNSQGTKLVYCSDSVSLAVLENLVHFDVDIAPSLYLYEVEIKVSQVKMGSLDIKYLNDEEMSKKYGDEWTLSASSLVLSVPSAVINKQNNFLLNPNHPDFKIINIIEHGLFDLDSRLSK